MNFHGFPVRSSLEALVYANGEAMPMPLLPKVFSTENLDFGLELDIVSTETVMSVLDNEMHKLFNRQEKDCFLCVIWMFN